MSWIQNRAGGGQKATNFAVACSLLSQYVKDKGGAPDLGLGAAKGGFEAMRAPATALSLLPGGEEGNPMNLFPQRSGLGPSRAEDSTKNSNREADKGQLTIFYGGKVLVFDDFPAEKAKDLLHLAGKGESAAPSVTAVAGAVNCQNDSAKEDCKVLPVSVDVSPVSVNRLQVPAQQKLSELPLARKASLQRFLEKRKDRVNARAPYQTIGSYAKADPAKSEESKTWLGLSPQVSESSHSLNSD